MNSILRRRSIRQYTGQKIQAEHIKKILEAAMSAPSAGNEQPWHFIIVNDTQMLERLSQIHRHASMVKHAAAAIVVCGDLNLEIKKGMWVQDCSAATENILIEVEELNLGAVWVGVYPREDRIKHVQKLFDLPINVIPMSIVPIGYPAENFDTYSRYDESRVHYEAW
jgi:nitroreductase